MLAIGLSDTVPQATPSCPVVSTSAQMAISVIPWILLYGRMHHTLSFWYHEDAHDKKNRSILRARELEDEKRLSDRKITQNLMHSPNKEVFA